MQRGFDGVGYTLNVSWRKIGVHRQTENTGGGTLGMGKAACAESELLSKRREDRLQVKRDRIMHCRRYAGFAHGRFDGFAVVYFDRVLRPDARAARGNGRSLDCAFEH